MTAFIYLDPAAIRPVIENVWHRTRLSTIPTLGEVVTMLCGETAAATFETSDKRHAHGVPTQCPFCDVVYRREHGIPIPDHHPGLRQAS